MEQSNMSDLQRMSGLLSPRQLLMVLSDLLKEADSYHVIIDHSLNPFFSDWNLVVTEFFNVFVRDVARCLEAILDKSMTFEVSYYLLWKTCAIIYFLFLAGCARK